MELIVVLVIMSVILAVTAPRLAGRGQQAILRGAAHELQTLAVAARARAVLSGETVTLLLHREGRVARLINEVPAGDETRIVDLVPPRTLPNTIRAEFRPDGDGDANRLQFRPDGSADGGELNLSATTGNALELRLIEPLGLLRVVQPS